MGRPGPGGHPQGDPPHHAHPGGRPVTDDIDTVGKILLRYAGSGKKMGSGPYITSGRQETGHATGSSRHRLCPLSDGNLR